MVPRPAAAQQNAQEGAVVTRAALRAAEQLEVTAKTLASVIGISEATVSRMRKGEFQLEPGSKAFELAILFIRMFRSLDAIAGGDERIARSWLKNANTVIGARPADHMLTISGLIDVIAYLDSRRALV